METISTCTRKTNTEITPNILPTVSEDICVQYKRMLHKCEIETYFCSLLKETIEKNCTK